jgi:ribosome biogenesis GTPase A
MTPKIQWYPGHIAKAEKALREQLKLVDVVLEVRDARIPLATHHRDVPQWSGDKARILVVNRVDAISPPQRDRWQKWFASQGEKPYFTNAQQGKGVAGVAKAAQACGQEVNKKRTRRGMRPRAVRAVVVGFPNVGKSALINRLLRRRAVASARRPGVTRQLQWVRLSDRLELLDAPGVIPAQLADQEQALKLAICDDIGTAAYDNQRVAAELVELLKNFPNEEKDASMAALRDRYHIDPEPVSGEMFLYQFAEHRHQGDGERAAVALLNDFRQGKLGKCCLEYPPFDR